MSAAFLGGDGDLCQVPYYVVLDEKFKTNKANVQPRQRMPTYPAYEAPHMRCEDLGLLVEPKPASTRQLSLSKFANRPHPANQKQKVRDLGGRVARRPAQCSCRCSRWGRAGVDGKCLDAPGDAVLYNPVDENTATWSMRICWLENKQTWVLGMYGTISNL